MSKLAKATVGLMLVTMLSKILGFVRELVLASAYGASAYSDAYLVALNIPTVIFVAIGTALSTTFIPMYYESKKNGGKNESVLFTNNVLNIVVIISGIFAILGLIFTDELVKIFAIGFKGETFSIAVDFTRILILAIIFIALSEMMRGYLNANDNFTIPGIMMGIPFNIVVIVSIILSTKTSPYMLAFGTLVAISTKFIFQVPFAYKYGYKYKLHIDYKDKYVKKMVWLLGPVFIGVAVTQINAMIDRTLASTLIEGSISALNYANRLNSFVMGLFITSIASVVYPMLSKLSSEDNKDKFVDAISSSVNTIILLVLPVSVGAIILSTPIVKVLFERGAFNTTATQMTSIALVFYSIGTVAFGLNDILGKVFYSLQDTKTPMINGIISMTINIILNLILVKYMKHAGLAFATSLSALISIMLLFNSLKRKIGYYGQDKIIITIIKSLIAAIFMGIITKMSYDYLYAIIGNNEIGEISVLAISIILGAIVYGISIYILKVDEIKILTDKIRLKINK